MPPFDESDDVVAGPASSSFSLSLGVVLALSVSLFLIVSCLTIAFHATKLRRFIRTRLANNNDTTTSSSSSCSTAGPAATASVNNNNNCDNNFQVKKNSEKKIFGNGFIVLQSVIFILFGMVETVLRDKSRRAGHVGWTKKVNACKKSPLPWKLNFLDSAFVKTAASSSIVTASHMIADPRKSNALGEDAYFVSGSWAGIADGVGGWRSQGIDPGKFSRALMQALCEMVSEVDNSVNLSVGIHGTVKDELESQNCVSGNHDQKSSPPKLDALIKTAFQSVVASQRKLLSGLLGNPKKRGEIRESIIQGSSTVLLYHLDVKRSVLYCANIGDCELLVLRQVQSTVAGDSSNVDNNGQDARELSYGIIDRIIPGCFSFNMPHQIGMQIIGASLDVIDCPHITVQKIKVQVGDIVIAGSDGLFDNVFEEELVEMTGQFVSNCKNDTDSLEKANWEKLAKNLTKLAIRYGKDRKYLSPFAMKASEVSGTKMRGGKLDDTTVLVSYIA